MADTPQSYKILGLRTENYKRISAVNITPEGDVVVLSGRNAQGKSSIIDSIYAALCGAKAAASVPIRQGAEASVIKLDLGELRVTRTFKMKDDEKVGTTLTVESPFGAKYTKPQEVLDAIVGELAFDPIAFSRKSPKEQFESIKALVPNIDFAALAAANKADFDERAIQNRKAKDARAQAAGLPDPLPGDDKLNTADLEKRYDAAITHNADVTARKARRDSAVASVAELNRQIAELTAKRDDLQAKLNAAGELPELIDVDALKADLDKARAASARLANNARRAELIKEADAAIAESERLTAVMEAREKLKRETIAAANLPVDGLSIEGETVLLGGLPLDQASQAQQWAVGVSVATALNPKLRVIFIRDGSLLDKDAMTWLSDFAAKNDMQVWVERVTDGEGVGFVIEDGHILGQEPATEPEATTAPATQEEAF